MPILFGSVIHMENSKHFIWMPLIGFDRDKEDKGVGEYLDGVGFIPAGMSVFLFHSDIINQHEGMETEFTLHPDNCSYYGSPRNEFRERQPWTNFELRTLANNLSARGIEAYMGVMGVYLEDSRHKEWESDHKELLSFGLNGRMNLNVLKRFADGTYYEDFFAEKALAALEDYGFAGLHVSDFFCPPEHGIMNGDFSADMMDQFITHTGITLPAELTARLSFDEQADIDARGAYIWQHLRHEWIDFYAWRWEKFWGKVAAKLHAHGKKIMVNNAWCADPFEALYRYGIDYKRLYAAGVDYFVAETVPEGLEMVDCTRDLFRPLMLMPQLMNAFSPEGKLLTLLGVKDCTEEWDMLHHAPPRLERDMYVLASLYASRGGDLRRCVDGYMVTLGDGITKDEWTWIRGRDEIAHGADPAAVTAPTVIWSDAAHYAFLDAYTETRRPSVHELVCRLQQANAQLGAVARIEEIDTLCGPLFVPNFDLLPEAEKAAVLNYKKAPVICTALKAYTDTASVPADICVSDSFANCPLSVFALNLPLTGEQKEAVAACLADGTAVIDVPGDPKEWIDPPFFTTPMLFVKMSESFKNACKTLLELTGASPFRSQHGIFTMLLKNGKYRVYIFNPRNNYLRAEVHCGKRVLSVENVSVFPLMPPKMIAAVTTAGKGDGAKAHLMQVEDPNARAAGFIGKVQPCGVSIFDVTVE